MSILTRREYILKYLLQLRTKAGSRGEVPPKRGKSSAYEGSLAMSISCTRWSAVSCFFARGKTMWCFPYRWQTHCIFWGGIEGVIPLQTHESDGRHVDIQMRMQFFLSCHAISMAGSQETNKRRCERRRKVDHLEILFVWNISKEIFWLTFAGQVVLKSTQESPWIRSWRGPILHKISKMIIT